MKIFTVTVSGGKEVSRLTFSGGLQATHGKYGHGGCDSAVSAGDVLI